MASEPSSEGDHSGGVAAPAAPLGRVALLGNPNTGKTSLFNRVCGLRAHVANYPGITADARVGQAKSLETATAIVDLPGVYSLDLDLPESQLAKQLLSGEHRSSRDGERPDRVLVIVDATNLKRNLTLLGEATRAGLPIAVGLTMTDLAKNRGLEVSTEQLSAELGVPVTALNPRVGEGVRETLASLPNAVLVAGSAGSAPTDDRAALEGWAQEIADRVTTSKETGPDQVADRLDRVLTHPLLGTLTFLAIMGSIFWVIFSLAGVPMDAIETLFGAISEGVASVLPEGLVRDLIVDGVIAGIGGTVIFLPQICLLFFLLTLLEDTGYLGRAAFVANRLLRPFGLPGQAFVPLLSSHACAIPGIMCSRLIPDRRDRLATILVAPFLSCSARLPVYTLLIGILFADQPGYAGLAFAGCYFLGGFAALVTAFLFRKTFLRGRSRPMVLELPPYRRPSLKNALWTAYDNGKTFLVKAGTVIVMISIVLWWLATFPMTTESPAIEELRTQAAAVEATDSDRAAELTDQADRQASRDALSASFSGRIGRTVEPVFEPMGSDWQLTIAILSSFAAREVFVSALTVTLGAGEVEEDRRIRSVVENATRDDGTTLVTPASALALLVFFVLAMQCLPTLAVTRREAGGWRYAALQFGYMSLVAWILAVITYQVAS